MKLRKGIRAVLSCTDLSKTFADGLEDGIVLDVVGVVGLELSGDTSEGALQSLFGRGVDHLGLLLGVSRLLVVALFSCRETYLNAGIIGRPGNEGNLVAGEELARSICGMSCLIATYRIPSPEASEYSKS